MTSAGGNDLSNSSSHGIPRAIVVVAASIGLPMREQLFALVVGLLVIKILIMWKSRRRIESVHHAGHICVDEADQFVIARIREGYAERLALGERGCADTG